MVHGLAALVAARRDDRAAAAAHLAAVCDEPLDTPRARANSLPLLTARAVAAERDLDPAAALDVLRPLLDADWAQSERHLLLPELARLAVAVGDLDAARRAVETCTAIADADPTDSRRVAVDRCRGMLDGDPAPILAAAAHYRAVGRVPELGQALEDAAVLLARRGDIEAARAAFTEAVDRYSQLGAAWDLRRADARIRPYGVRRGSRGPRRRPPYGWEALTSTELVIAELVAKGRSNPDIAAELLLSRRTVQSHVSHILTKLSARSRVEIAREAVQHTAAG
jgi:DNA-binding CsgD family transcriptional regulator